MSLELEELKDKRFEFGEKFCIQIRDDAVLSVGYGNPVRVHEFKGLPDVDHMQVTELASLGINCARFGLSNYKNEKLLLSGGELDGKKTDQTYLFDLTNLSWNEGPKMI